MRTYSRADWINSQAAWDDGGFGQRWAHIRSIAADRGFIYPPQGSAHDDRDAESPSQRAIIWRALEDNPAQLERIVARSRSWYDVVDGIIGLEARLRQDVDEFERIDAFERKDDPTHRESVASLGSILQRIEDSR